MNSATSSSPRSPRLSRRTLMLGAGASCVAAPALLGGCGAADELIFWNLPWGNATFAEVDQQISDAYAPADGLPEVTYQQIQWSNYIQVFSTALASNTGPAVSGGGGTMAFLFADQGHVAYADDLIESWKSDGLYDDFFPGLFEIFKTDKGTVALPYNVDMRVLWYNTKLLDKAGAEPPTDWQSYLETCKALKKIDVFGFSAAGGPSGGANQVLTTWMVNNGGGMFDETQQPNCVTPANIETIEFILELVAKQYVDPRAVSYTHKNVYDQWKNGSYALGVEPPGLAENVGDGGADLAVLSPITAPSGGKGGLILVGPTLMYASTPSQAGSEAFLTYYYKNLSRLWTDKTGVGLPVLKSLTETDTFKADKNRVKIMDEWLPVGHTYAAPGGRSLYLNITSVDGGAQATEHFQQAVLGGQMGAKEALTMLEKELKETVPVKA